MWSVFLILIITFMIFLFEMPKLKKQQNYTKDLFAFLGLLSIGCILSIFQSIDVPIPNPLDGIVFIYKPISDFFFALLK